MVRMLALMAFSAAALGAPLAAIPTVYVVPMGMIQTAYSELYARIQIVEIGQGFIAVEGIDNSTSFDGRTGHQIIFDSAARIDEFAAILKARLAETQTRIAGQ